MEESVMSDAGVRIDRGGTDAEGLVHGSWGRGTLFRRSYASWT
jgi:hypothetical protein